MQRPFVILISLILCLLIALPSAHSQKDVDSFSIKYNHADLRMIEVKDDQLHHAYHSLRHFEGGRDKTVRKRLWVSLRDCCKRSHR